MNNNKPPQKSLNTGKTRMLNTFETLRDTPKTNLFNIKTSKKQTQKTPFCHVQKQPTIFHKFSVFFQHTVFVFEKLCFAENTIKLVFSGKHNFSITQLVKPTFSTMSKKHLFPKKGVIFVFSAISAETPIFTSVSCFTLFWSKEHILAKTDSVHEHARFFSLPDTNSVRQFFANNPFFLIFHIFGWAPYKNPIFIGFSWPFPFSFSLFSVSISPTLKKTKMQFSIRKPQFW